VSEYQQYENTNSDVNTEGEQEYEDGDAFEGEPELSEQQ